MAMTKREFYCNVINAQISEEMTEAAESFIAKLDEANAKRKDTLTKNQSANNEIKARIIDGMEKGVAYTAAEVATQFELSSTSKASALLRQLVEEDKVVAGEVRIKNKGKVKTYTKPDSEVAE